MTTMEGDEMVKKVTKTAAVKNVKKTAKAAPKKTAAAKKSQSAAVKKNASGKTSSASKPTAKKAVPTKKAPAKKAVPVKAPAKKVPAKKAVPAKAPAKKAPVKKAVPAKAPAKKAPDKKAVPVKAPVVKKTAKTEKSPAVKSLTRVRKDEILKKLRLSKSDKKYFYDLLMRARSAFGAQVQYHTDDALTRKDAAGERAGMATHMADLGTDNYRRDFELGLLSDGVDVLEMIDEALQRLEDSEYGICLDCGEPIPRKRLEAKPYAKYCTKCKSKREEMDETYYHRR